MQKRSSFLNVLAPSFLSGFVSVLLSIAVIGVVLTPILFKGSYLEQYGEAVKDNPGDWYATYVQITNELNSSEAIANIAVFCAWAVVGFAMYYLVVSILSLFVNVVSFAHLLGFKNTDKKTLVAEASVHLLIRTLGIIGLALFLIVTLQLLVPAILTIIAAAFSSSLIIGALYILAAGVFIWAILHIIVVFIRIIFLRVRLISWMYDTSDL